jgi:uncharacterized membrane protein HdeD (DUF308 family)
MYTIQLVGILLGADYLRSRWQGILQAGCLGIVFGVTIIADTYFHPQSVHFPLRPFGALLLLEGAITLSVARTGTGGQRKLRYAKGAAFALTGLLILSGQYLGEFVLAMIFGTLTLLDGLMQAVSAHVIRYRMWRLAMAGAALEIAVAISIYQPWPTHYVGTVPFCLGLGLCFAGWNLILLASRVRRLGRIRSALTSDVHTLVEDDRDGGIGNADWTPGDRKVVRFNGPPGSEEPALTVHVWTPVGSAKTQAHGQPIVRRYIGALDSQGAISTGHAALETPEGVYVSLYPAEEIDRTSGEFVRLLRATGENDVRGVFQPDYATESVRWCPSTVQVRIRNYDPLRLQDFWHAYHGNTTYNLTSRNCSTSVALALEAALEGVAARVWGPLGGWQPLLRVLATPELWVAGQIRKRAVTMTWTPGLALDYARALSMLADPRVNLWAGLIQSRRRLRAVTSR